LLAVDAGLLSYFLELPTLQREDAFFGIRVSPEVYGGTGRRILRRYRFWLALAFLLIESAALSVFIYSSNTTDLRIGSITYPRIIALLLLAVTAILIYAASHRQLKDFEITAENGPIAASIKAREFADYTSIALEAAIALMTFAPISLLIYYYPSLPERIPWHMNTGGQLDASMGKSLYSVFCIPILILYAQGWFLLVKHGLVRATMTLPTAHTERYLKYKEESFELGLKLLDWLRLIFAVPLSFIAPLIIFRTVEMIQFWTVAGVIFGVSWGIMALFCFNYYGHRLTDIHHKLREESGRVYVQRPIDRAHWYAGKLFYYNPGNPALFVETPVGPSYTINLANKWAFVHIGYLTGMVSLIIMTLRIL
jgi:uncharacterized membrane protein